jgi:hypothetical protein
MKLTFASLFAALTGGANAPKTLEAARSTFAEAKAALDRVGTMFTNAALDFDALLAKGENGLKDFVAELQGKVTTAEAAALEAKNALTEANGKISLARGAELAAEAKVTALNSLFASIGFKPAEVKGKDGAPATAEETAAALQTQFATHVSGSVTQKLQEIGHPAAKLPPSNPSGGANATEQELLADLAEAKTPEAKGRIARALNTLRDAQWSGKN